MATRSINGKFDDDKKQNSKNDRNNNSNTKTTFEGPTLPFTKKMALGNHELRSAGRTDKAAH